LKSQNYGKLLNPGFVFKSKQFSIERIAFQWLRGAGAAQIISSAAKLKSRLESSLKMQPKSIYFAN
jgi:hypothetical protein